MRVEKIYLREVGPFDEVEIELPPGTKGDAADVYLLTGPNGCGKSTILYAIASVMGAGHNSLGYPLLQRRMRSARALALMAGGGYTFAGSWHRDGRTKRDSLASKWGTLAAVNVTGPLAFYRGGMVLPFRADYGSLANEYDPYMPRDTGQRFDWAAFAYAGVRGLTDVQVTALEEPDISPFANSLSFFATADSSVLANWVASQYFLALKARLAQRDERATQLLQSRHDIERIVSAILGQSFAFHTSDEDNNVRVKLDGRVVDFAVLPAGLVSIVSWVADLLMRLDRIPWVGDLPPMQRSFLLLLDEIDIHLHPAWQRKVLPIAQQMFPNAQIIASTHSPFVVASADDAHIIALDVKDGVARLAKTYESQRGRSYGAILHSIFGITSDFDTDTEELFDRFHTQRNVVLADPTADRTELDRVAGELMARGEEVRALVSIELRQIDRVRPRATAP